MVPDSTAGGSECDSVTGYDQIDWSWESLGQHLMKDNLQQLGGEIQRELDELSQSLDDVNEEQLIQIKKQLRTVECLIDKIENANDQ